MQIIPFLDLAIGYRAEQVEQPSTLILLCLVIGIEGFLLYKLKYKRLTKSILDALIINVVSTAAGFLLSKFAGLSTDILDLFLSFFLLTVLIETGILMLIKGEVETKKVLIAMLVVNAVSYGIILIWLGFFEY